VGLKSTLFFFFSQFGGGSFVASGMQQHLPFSKVTLRYPLSQLTILLQGVECVTLPFLASQKSAIFDGLGLDSLELNEVDDNDDDDETDDDTETDDDSGHDDVDSGHDDVDSGHDDVDSGHDDVDSGHDVDGHDDRDDSGHDVDGHDVPPPLDKLTKVAMKATRIRNFNIF